MKSTDHTSVGAGAKEAEILLERYEEEPSHVRHVADLALQLFDSLKEWHQYGDKERQYLYLAALLHDIGWSQSPSGEGYHKQSARLISEYDWKELSPKEIAIVAQTARYHRRALPSDKHEAYAELNAERQRLVRELAGILRVADALDRTHVQVVRKITARVLAEVIELTVQARGPWINERMAVAKKCDLLEIASRRKVTFAE